MTNTEYILAFALCITNTLWFITFKAFYKEVKKQIKERGL